MLDRRDIARLFMTRCSNRDSDDPRAERARVEREVTSLGVCGYCVFGGELGRAREFNREMTAAAGRPLLVASDLEQGLGQQLDGGTVFPCQMAVGAASSDEFAVVAGSGDPAGTANAPGTLARRVGEAVGREAASVGINVVFAPVADLATESANPIIGVRSYGASPERVAAMTAAYVSGLQSTGVAATAKHFPGHGDTVVDSHIELPVVDVGRGTLDARELVPFRAAVRAGVRLVMTGHLAFPALAGRDVPATLSPEVGERLLRGELGFDGVVVTDALLMGAVASRHGPDEASVLAVLAGADVLLMPPDLDAAIDGIARAVESGRVPQSRVARSLRRIDELAGCVASSRPEEQVSAPAGEAVRTMADHARLSAEVAGRAVTLLSGEAGRWLDPGLLSAGRASLAALVDSERQPDLSALRSRLAGLSGGADLLVLSEGTASGDLERFVSETAEADVCVLFVFDHPAAWKGRKGFSPSLTQAAARALKAAGTGAAVVFAGPELAGPFADDGLVLCCYDGSPPMQTAAFDVLVGAASPRGALPVPERG